MSTARLLYCNLTKGTLSTSATGGNAPTGFLGALKFGDTIKLGLRLLKEVGSVVVEASDVAIQGIKITISPADRRPTSGYYKLQINNIETEPIAKNASAQELEDELNRVAVLYGNTSNPWSVSFINGSYIIKHPLAGYYPITSTENKLSPISFVTLKAWELDDVKFQSIRLTQAPCAVTTDFSLVVPNQPYVTRILGGQYPTALNEGTDEVQQLIVPNEFRGGFQVKRDQIGSLVLGTTLDAATLKESLDKMSKNLKGTYTIGTPVQGEKRFTITFGGGLGQSPQPMLTINVVDSPNGDLTFRLPLDSISLLEAINNKTPLVMEGEGIVTDDQTTRKITLFSFPITITNKISEPQQTALSNVNWAVPPEPSNYIPYSPSQVLFGSQHYEAIIGGALSKRYDITHNLNPAGNTTIYGIHLTLRTNTAGGRRLRDDEYALTFGDNNNLSITTTADWPANGLIATISTAGPRSAFQQHQHSIAEITGLSQEIEDLNDQVDQIVAVMPAIRETLNTLQTSSNAEFATPINSTFSVLGVSKYKDGTALPAYGTDEASYLMQTAKWNLEKLPRTAPMLYGAIHDGEVEDVTTAPTRGRANGVYKNVSTNSFKINGEIVAPNEFVGSNGTLVYKVFQPDATKPTYYPTAYEKTLWTIVSNDQLLCIGRYFQAMFAIGTSSYLSNVAVKFSVVVEHGQFVEEESASYGANLERLAFTHTALSQSIIVSPQPQQHLYGLKISRALIADVDATPITYTETFKQDKNIAGLWSGTTTIPTSANIAIRARVTMFDIENTANAKGFIGINLMGNDEVAITPTERLELGKKPKFVFATLT